MGKEKAPQVQETQRVLNRINQGKHPILIEGTQIKHKEQILQAAREKQQINHKVISKMIATDHSIETLQARREWQDIIKVMKWWKRKTKQNKTKNYNQDYSTQQLSQSDLKEISKALPICIS